MWQGVNPRLLGGVCRNTAWYTPSVLVLKHLIRLLLTQACQCVHAIDVHGAASTDTLSATPSECKSRVRLVLDSDERVQHHRPGLVQVQAV